MGERGVGYLGLVNVLLGLFWDKNIVVINGYQSIHLVWKDIERVFDERGS